MASRDSRGNQDSVIDAVERNARERERALREANSRYGQEQDLVAGLDAPSACGSPAPAGAGEPDPIAVLGVPERPLARLMAELREEILDEAARMIEQAMEGVRRG
jgi:hypothetical protein